MENVNLGEGIQILGRSESKIAKYGERATAYIGKVVMSGGQTPVLGRKVLIDIAEPHMILVCGKRGGGKCLDGDTLIPLADGSLKPIRELAQESNKVASLNADYKIVGSEKTEFFSRTVNELLEIELHSGKKIKLTPEHPLLTISGWFPAKDLPIGSRIATPRIQPFFGSEFVSEAETKLLAYLIAEGHLARHAVWFSNTDEAIQGDFENALKEFDSNLRVEPVASNACLRVVAGFRPKKNRDYPVKMDLTRKPHRLKQRLKELSLFNVNSHTKFIPDSILKSPEQKVSLFLNRLFSCDGTIFFDANTESWRIAYASVSEQLIRQVQHLLNRFGILSVLRKKNTVFEGRVFPSFELELRGNNVEFFLKKIGFFGQKETRQKEALEQIKSIKRNANTDTIPKEIWNQYRPESWAKIGREMGLTFPKSLRESIHYAPTRLKLLQIARLDHNKIIEKLADSDIFWDEIKSVRVLSGPCEVFDISVPEHHNFVANDIIVHNSYTMSVIIEEFARQMADIKSRISVITIDTVGIFWTLKIPNSREKAELKSWDLEPDSSPVRVMVPAGKLEFYQKNGIPVDGAFTLKVSELEGVEWLALFKLTWKDPEGVLLTRLVEDIKEKLGTYYGIDDMIKMVRQDPESDALTKSALIGRLGAAKTWGLLEKDGTKLSELAKPGVVTIIDVSAYRQAIGMEGPRDIIVALVGKKLFEERMLYRKKEEANLIAGGSRESKMPLIWMLIDEAHMFMPKDEQNVALDVLLEWVRVGRQPGLSLLLATQRPNKIHPDAISQCDLFISHRMTAQSDIAAVSELRPTYLHSDFDKLYQEMPRGKGYALILDDNTEKLWLVKIRPRFSWDGGVTATAFTD